MYNLKIFENGFEYIDIVNDSASAKIALQGAHIFEYMKEEKKNLLWVSKASKFENSVAIRGGIPLCWPRFGSLDSTLPKHGFARTSLFTLVSVKEIDAHKTEVLLRLTETEETLKLWNYRFVLELKITIAEQLTLSLSTTNKSGEELMITQALHSYFPVSEIQNVMIKGLETKRYYDALSDKYEKESQSIQFTQELDRVYQDVNSDIYLIDRDKTTNITTKGSHSTVVWNPWIDKCSRMSHMDSDDYRYFVCIESANAFDDFKMIKSQKTHTLSLVVSF